MRVRTKVVALLVSLVALWAFAAFVTLREGLNLLWVAALDKGVAQPNESLLLAMEQERRLSMVVLGSGGRLQRATRRSSALTRRSTCSEGWKGPAPRSTTQPSTALGLLPFSPTSSAPAIGSMTPWRRWTNQALPRTCARSSRRAGPGSCCRRKTHCSPVCSRQGGSPTGSMGTSCG